MQDQPFGPRRGGLELFGQPRVDLDDVQPRDRLEQRAGEGAAAAADLHHAVIGGRVDGRDQPGDHRGVVQEVLPQPFSRSQGHSRRISVNAKSTAWCRLSGLARPVPARSSAVPWSTEVRTMGSPSVTLTVSPNASALIAGRPWS